MFCKFCGARTEDTASFCPSCGNNLKISQEPLAPAQVDSVAGDRMITVTRLKRLTAALIKIEVFCDDEYMGILKAGESVSFDVDSRASHKVYAVCNTTNSTAVGSSVTKHVSVGSAMTATGKSNVVQIKPGTDEVRLNLYLKMGFAAPNVIIERE